MLGRLDEIIGVLNVRNIWVVRAGGGGVHADEFEEGGIAAIGFSVKNVSH